MDKPGRMYEQPRRQAAINFLSFWDEHREDRCRFNDAPQHLEEARLQLFLSLPVVDSCGTPSCMFSEPQTCNYERCRLLIDNFKLYRAFTDLHFKAGDPLLKENDPDLVNGLADFITCASCETHEGSLPQAEAQARRLMVYLNAWRKEYLINDRPSLELSPPEDDLEPQPSRLSRFFTAGKMGSLNKAARRRDRSVSPASTAPDADENWIPVTRPLPQQILRPMASAPDVKRQGRASQYAPRDSVDGSQEGLRVDGRAARDRKNTLLGVGAGIMTKLAAKI